MTDTLEQTLQKNFGFDAFRPGQKQVIEHLISGHSAAAIFPTGAGKSLCYQLPALCLSGLTLVVSPLIALMKDQIDALHRRGISAARLDSTLNAEEYRDVMGRMKSGQLRILYVAPERFNNERFREVIQRANISLFAVDEAHCISEWGHNFRPDYLKLPEYAKRCGVKRILALTATATESVLADICRAFKIDKECATRTGFYRSNLQIEMTPVTSSDRDDLLINRLQERATGATIVYVTLQRTAEEVARKLQQAGFRAKAYHAGMKNEERSSVQDWFMAENNAIVVATIAFGMGIDKANIRYVYHYNVPKSLENYSQEIGRAGRDDQLSICEMLVNPEDLNVLENFIYGDTPTLSAIQSFVTEVFSQPKSFDVSTYAFSREHDIRLLVVRTLLTYLELQGYLEGGTPFYSEYQFKPLLPSTKILQQFEGERRDFLAAVFRQAKKGKIWFKIDAEQAAKEIAVPRNKIIAALDYLGEQEMLEVKASGVRQRYTQLKQPENLADLGKSLHETMRQREQADIARLKQVLDLVQLDSCQVASLAAYFGEELAKECGHCTWCISHKLGEKPIQLKRPTEKFIFDKTMQDEIKTLVSTKPEFFSDPEIIVRMLCGVTSPAISQNKLRAHPLFGRLEKIPFALIREQMNQVFDM